MKKYTIKDKSGTKKTIYAKDLSHALTFVDSKAKDAVEDDALEGEYHTEYGDKLIVSKVNASTYSYFDVDTKHTIRVSINALKEDIRAKRLIKDSIKDAVSLRKGDWFTTSYDAYNNKLFKVIDDKLQERNGFTKSLLAEVYQVDRWTLTIKKYGTQTITPTSLKQAIVFGSVEEALKWLRHRLNIAKNNDAIKDEANLPTTIQALVNDEEAAIKAYEVAIKNLEGKIDETQMQVLINIMKDERRHVENLYAILNGKVTEKNLEDSIKDATLEITVKNQSEYSEIDSIAKKLHLSFYETAGNKAILEGSRKDLEEYIDLVWGGDASIKRQIRG